MNESAHDSIKCLNGSFVAKSSNSMVFNRYIDFCRTQTNELQIQGLMCIFSDMLFYLKNNNLLDRVARFDVIEVLDGQINHIENAFN